MTFALVLAYFHSLQVLAGFAVIALEHFPQHGDSSVLEVALALTGAVIVTGAGAAAVVDDSVAAVTLFQQAWHVPQLHALIVEQPNSGSLVLKRLAPWCAGQSQDQPVSIVSVPCDKISPINRAGSTKFSYDN